MIRLATLLLLLAAAAPGQFLEFQVRFDDGGCLSCAESLETRLHRVRGVEKVSLDLEQGVIRLQLAEDNRVRLVPLMARIEQGATKALETKLTAKGLLADDGSKLELQGSATGQVYSLEGDTSSLQGLVIVEAELVDQAAGRLRIVSMRPVK